MAQPVQLFVPTFRVEETLAEVRQCLEKGWTGLGWKTEEFEKAWCAFTGLPHAHFLNSATSALHLAVELLREQHGWRDGDEVVTTPITFVSTNHAILYAGLRPVFADVDASGNLSPESVSAAITERTRAVMFVGLGGNTANLDAVAQICRERGLRLILDAAHMAGSRHHGRHVGREADVSCWSFQAVKNLPTGDSGMVCFADAELDALARKRSWLGISKNTYERTGRAGTYRWDYDVEALGYKYNGNSIMAAVGLVGLRYLDQDNAYRRQLAAWYDEALSGFSTPQVIPHTAGSSRHLCQVRADRRDDLMVYLNANDVFPGVHYKDNRKFRVFVRCAGITPTASAYSESVLSLPLHLRMGYDDVVRVAELIRTFYAR